jgi:hypothetical protein
MAAGKAKFTVTYHNAPILEEVVGKKRPLSDVMRKFFRPSASVMNLIGQEMIAGYKGGPSINVASLSFGPKGGIRNRSSAGRYSNGIWQQRSPDGTNYLPLKASTVKLKKRSNRPDGKEASRTPNMALLDQHILVNDLLTLRTSNSVSVIYANPETDRISKFHEKGGTAFTGLTKFSGKTKKGKEKKRPPIPVTVLPRRHRGIQQEVAEKIRGILTKWFNRKLE